MKYLHSILILMSTIFLPTINSQNHNLFINKHALEEVKAGKRFTRQTNADQMVQNILQWLQGVYTQNSRKIRQGSLREYLPPTNTQKPRPFQPASSEETESFKPNDNNIINNGYPPAGSIKPRPPFNNEVDNFPILNPPEEIPNFNGYPSSLKPQPPFTLTTNNPNTGYTTYFNKPIPSYLPPNTNNPSTGYPSSGTTYPSFPSPNFPNPSTEFPNPTTNYPGVNTSPNVEYPSLSTENPGFPTDYPGTGYPSTGTKYPIPSTGYPTTRYPSPSPGPSTTFSNFNTGYPSFGSSYPQPTTSGPLPSTLSPETVTDFPTSSARPFPTGYPTSKSTTGESSETQPSTTTPQSIPPFTIPSGETTQATSSSSEEPTTTQIPDENNHPPHIHAIDVECSKDMMTIHIEFNRKFDGIIYSKGHFNNPECRYVNENSGQTKYTFTVSLNSCGTEFINAFDTQGKSYLENVLVLQNEAGIQEVWDTIRSVRCLWEGNLKKELNVTLSVGMLNQEIVTFSGDTAMARLDIQLGKGPFAPPANGLIKIGEVMTLVVSITGDPGFDVQVKDCKARDSKGENVVELTDDQGCVLKPKVFGAFQKTRDTGNTGASIIAYAFFNAFKFPDVMDLSLECNVDLCKTDCGMCPDPNQKIEPSRRRKRNVQSENTTVFDDSSIIMKKTLRIFVPEDVEDTDALFNTSFHEGICMSAEEFTLISFILLSVVIVSTSTSIFMWLKHQRFSSKF